MVINISKNPICKYLVLFLSLNIFLLFSTGVIASECTDACSGYDYGGCSFRDPNPCSGFPYCTGETCRYNCHEIGPSDCSERLGSEWIICYCWDDVHCDYCNCPAQCPVQPCDYKCEQEGYSVAGIGQNINLCNGFPFCAGETCHYSCVNFGIGYNKDPSFYCSCWEEEFCNCRSECCESGCTMSGGCGTTIRNDNLCVGDGFCNENCKCECPNTCWSLGYECGVQNNGCGGTINCGTCSNGYECQNGECNLIAEDDATYTIMVSPQNWGQICLNSQCTSTSKTITVAAGTYVSISASNYPGYALDYMWASNGYTQTFSPLPSFNALAGVVGTFIAYFDCTPNCVGKNCGSDGCSGSCGTCSGTDTCISGTCQSSGGEPRLTLIASPSSVPADGTTTSTLTAYSNPVNVGLYIVFSTTLGTLSRSSGTADSTGKYSVTITSNTAGTATVTADAGGYEPDTTTVTFTQITQNDCAPGSGPCCDTSGNFRSSSYICNYYYQTDYSCYWGTECGDDVAVRYNERHCSGSSYLCNGATNWTNYQFYDGCSDTERCTEGSSSCSYDPSCDCECSSGVCCDGCNYRESNFPCRASRGTCDLTEYCTGSSSTCPTDLYRQDTYLCDENYDAVYECRDGTACGDDVYVSYQDRYCSGSSYLCNGATVSNEFNLHDDCEDFERCTEGSYSCSYDIKCADIFPPITTIQCNDQTCLDQCWYNRDVSISLKCSDDVSGCDKTFYCYANNDWCDPSESIYYSTFILSGGTSYVRYFSVDKAENQEGVKSQLVKIDKSLDDTQTLETFITIDYLGPDRKPIYLSYTIYPQVTGITVSFDTNPVEGPPGSMMTIEVEPGTPEGTYTIALAGESEGMIRYEEFLLYLS
ncbi:MAG: invasin domain 3-containing protein [Candidatus Aenigmatarchaeota archaeon]